MPLFRSNGTAMIKEQFATAQTKVKDVRKQNLVALSRRLTNKEAQSGRTGKK
jgi:hypothetical protein